MPALEHNGKIVGESLDLIKYVDSNFEGPSLLPDVRCAEFIVAIDKKLLSHHLTSSNAMLCKYCRILRKESLLKNCFPTLIHSTSLCMVHSKETQQRKLVGFKSC